MVEKLASSEIAQSRDQLRREAVSKYQGDEPIRFQGDVQQIDAFRTGFDAGWQAAERDTRERCAQEIELAAENSLYPYALKVMAQRIRGKE